MHCSLLLALFFISCQKNSDQPHKAILQSSPKKLEIPLLTNPENFGEQLSNAALQVIDSNVVYTPDYVTIPYPGGDVPPKTGVCTDVVIRAFRKCNIDLQKEVHVDLKAHFSSYPNLKKWGLRTADKNIDHRRVPNLEVFFERKGKKLSNSTHSADYQPGDIVTWMINGKLPHIGIVTHIKKDGVPMVVHNVGGGQIIEDFLFNYPMVGHYRYIP
ncbi:MAG: hypothetical protein RL607_1713 [Bacteroidota bacterium]